MIDDAYVKYGPNPSSIPIAPKIIPNGITGIIKGKISKKIDTMGKIKQINDHLND